MPPYNLDALVGVAALARSAAHRELKAGRKQGHWIWYVFPTLAARGGDMFSARQSTPADLLDVAHLEAYAAHPQLRAQLIESFETATAAFAAVPHGQAPWHVLDAGFGRRADGVWLRGPVDSFKAFCSATAFAAVAHRRGDFELKRAALAMLGHFAGDVVYTGGERGTSGYTSNPEQRRTVLRGHDALTLQLVGGPSWEAIADAAPPGEGAHKRELGGAGLEAGAD
jgi:uncharacterized protein (DUF1810 family)